MLGSGHVAFWLGRKAEKEAISACEKHLEKIFTIVNRFKTFIDTFLDGDVQKARSLGNEIIVLEREADEIKEGIINELMNSSLHPMDQDEIIRLLLTSDDIAANLKSAVRKIQYSHPEDIPEDVKVRIKNLMDVLLEEAVALMDTIDALIKRSGEVVSKAEKTERLEEKIDELRVELIARILTWGDVAQHVSDWLMIKEVIENMETASDKMEDTADLLRVIAILRSRK